MNSQSASRKIFGTSVLLVFMLGACQKRVFSPSEIQNTQNSQPSLPISGDFESKIIQVGRYFSRAIFKAKIEGKAPLVILVPGSGPNGPRELIPKSLTVDEKDAPIFDQLSLALNRAGIQTLQLGKPGVEDRTIFDPGNIFYDLNLYKNLNWNDLLNNLDDAVAFALQQPTVDRERIWILGHSEGTQIAVDYAKSHSQPAGLILLGYSGEDVKTIVDWQIYRRSIDAFIALDVDANHDGFVSKTEASKWPAEFRWSWKEGEESISLARIEAEFRANANRKAAYSALEHSKLYENGIWNRGSIYSETASLKLPVYVFTGQLDLQTPPEQALKLGDACKAAQKSNCIVTIVPGLGHGFSVPKPPRAHPYLDMTVGPVSQDFLDTMSALKLP